MDPLSISASIIAVLQATNSVISLCYNYRAAAVNSSWELSRVIKLATSLRNVLEDLETLASDTTEDTRQGSISQLQTLRLLCRIEAGSERGVLIICLEELNDLQKKLSPPGWVGPVGSKRMALVQALKWPLKESDTKKALESIGRLRDTLNLALAADQTLLLKINEVVRATQDKTLSVETKVSGLTTSFSSIRLNEHREKIHQWLAAPDPSLNHVEALSKRQATTGSWLFGSSKFSDWKENSNSFLWMFGIPGCGKTVLTSMIIETVLEHCHGGTIPESPRAWAVAYFYFDFSNSEKRNHDKMIRSLLKQLSQQLQRPSEPMESLFSSCTNGSRQPTFEALQVTLKQMIQEFTQVFIILDALDECDNREALVGVINEIVGWNLQELHILSTSRMERDTADELDITEEQKVCIRSGLIEEDIRAYIYARLQTDKKLQRWQKNIEDQDTILIEVLGANRFRWVACQLDALRKCFSRRELLKALESLPRTLEETYDRILCSIDEDRYEIALRILQWLSYSIRPLRLEELADVVAVNVKSDPRFDPELRFSEPRDMLTICSSLVTLSTNAEDGSGGEAAEQIRLAHLSVREYLISDRILVGKAARYSVQDVSAHDSISQICLAYILQFDDPKLHRGAIVERFPLANYAARHWPRHVRASGKESDGVVLLVMELFSSRGVFINWVRLSKSKATLLASTNIYSDAAPLNYAVVVGLKELVRRLLEGVDLNKYCMLYESALLAAATEGFDDTIKLLLDKGVEVDDRYGKLGSALGAAAAGGHGKVVKTLIKAQANINQPGGFYGGALQAASVGGYTEIVEDLINAGADVHTYGGHYNTALHAAAYRGHDAIVRRLLNAGADMEATGKRGRTPLILASLAGQFKTARLLIDNGSNVNSRCRDGWTALGGASWAGRLDVVHFLLGAGAEVNAPDLQGQTALQYAASQGHTAILEFLLLHGAI
ncbi:hypothetical protein F5Y04DRAFT_290200 [Hypomontagnella monticulosa]|nr:hypothetical protein F5Y04DRAFT_290200 [Hypomontagnella monticulosa]